MIKIVEEPCDVHVVTIDHDSFETRLHKNDFSDGEKDLCRAFNRAAFVKHQPKCALGCGKPMTMMSGDLYMMIGIWVSDDDMFGCGLCLECAETLKDEKKWNAFIRQLTSIAFPDVTVREIANPCYPFRRMGDDEILNRATHREAGHA